MKYWYAVKLKDGTVVNFSSYQLVLFDLDKPLFIVDEISQMWKDKINNIRIVTSEIMYVRYGEKIGDD